MNEKDNYFQLNTIDDYGNANDDHGNAIDDHGNAIDDHGNANDDAPELTVSVESCIILNNVYQETIEEITNNIGSKLLENESRRLELQQSMSQPLSTPLLGTGHGHPNSLIPFMAPYFKDVKGLSAPANDDTLMKRRNGEINQSYLYQSKPWNKTEKNKLIEYVQMQIKAERLKQYNVEREKLTKDKSNITKPETIKRIKEIDKIISTINSKPIDSFEAKQNDTTIDWLTIAAQLDTIHSHHECEIMWNNRLHPSINNSEEWSNDEDERLKSLVQKYGNRNWDRVADELNSGRVPWQCCKRYQKHLNKDMKRTGPLTKAEAEMVEKVIGACRVGDYIPWHQVGYFIEGRTLPQIKHYWQKINMPKRGDVWTPLEDKVLTAAVKKYGNHNWRKVAFYLPGRTNRQCRERYIMRLGVRERKLGNWTEEEDREILKRAPETNFCWVKVEKFVNGRNARQIAGRYELLTKWSKMKNDNHHMQNQKKKQKNKTRSLKIHTKLYDKIKAIIDRFNPNNDKDLDKILRNGREELKRRFEKNYTGNTVSQGRRKKSKVEDDIDTKIARLFAINNKFKNKITLTDRSAEDQCIYDNTKLAVRCLLNDTSLNPSNQLSRVIHETFHRSITPKNEANSSRTNLNLSLFPPNRTSIRGLQGLLFQRDHLSRKIVNSKIADQISSFTVPESDKYKRLSSQFKSIFLWPALLSSVNPPESNIRMVPVPDTSGVGLRRGKSWLTTSGTRMIEIRSQQTQLIQTALRAKEEDKKNDDTNGNIINEHSSEIPWYLQPRERRNYQPKSLDKQSFIYTRLRAKRESIECDEPIPSTSHGSKRKANDEDETEISNSAKKLSVKRNANNKITRSKHTDNSESSHCKFINSFQPIDASETSSEIQSPNEISSESSMCALTKPVPNETVPKKRGRKSRQTN